MALAMTGGSLVAAGFLSSPTIAKPSTNYPSSITLTQSSNQLAITTTGNGGISAVGHSLTVTTTGELLGYTVTMSNTSSTTSAMVDKADSNKTIPSIPITTNANPQSLANSTYGYTLAKVTDLTKDQLSSDIWHGVPLLDTTPAELIKQDRPTAAEGDTIDITYGINTTGTKPGNYTTTVQYTATVTPKQVTYDATICKSGELTSACQVDLDANMIPIKYTGSADKAIWTAVTDPENETNPGEWYDYANKQWANAVTVNNKDNYCAKATNDALEFFRNQHEKCSNPISTIEMYKLFAKYQNEGKPIRNMISGSAIDSFIVQSDDILGYYVYIPRYAYEVMRPNAVDKVVTDEQAIAEGGFKIMFETKDDVKKNPHPTCNKLNPTKAEMWQGGEPNTDQSNVLAKDYRTDCVEELGFSRKYPGNNLGKSETDQNANQNSDTTWVTHPAFSWCKTTNPDGTKADCTELNGIWVGKFETTGSTMAPTIKPNQKHMSGQYIGTYYDIAKSMGIQDDNNIYGNNTVTAQSNQNLSTAKTYLPRNSEWGAIAYLSSSSYGAGVNKTCNNGNNQGGTDMNGKTSYGVTGCGPSGGVKSPGEEAYNDGIILNQSKYEDPQACSTTEDRSYSSEIGQLASTTNNVYGIYDMAGGTWEYTMGNLTLNDEVATSSISEYFKVPARLPYVNLYRTSNGFNTKLDWSISSSQDFYNSDVCTWSTCGGQALHETRAVQSIDGLEQSWGNDASRFLQSDSHWMLRSGEAGDGYYAGLFYYDRIFHGNVYKYGFRVVLMVN